MYHSRVTNSVPIETVGAGKIRNSNIELLRIIAMFLVLVVHADYFSLGEPNLSDFNTNAISSISRCFFESCSISCVNIFILISGWFGIKPTLRGFGNLVFQCAYFLVGIFSVMVMLHLTPFSVKGLASCFLLLDWNWFIKAYICLYILSPALNSICKKYNQDVLRMLLIAFFLFQSVYGWLTSGAKFFEFGYSTISFIGLYLLGRYIKIFQPPFTRYNLSKDWLLAIVSIIFLTVLECLRIYFHIPIPMMAYTNPLVIFIGISVLLIFTKINLQSKTINWIAASSFAVFLLHTNYCICTPYFKVHIINIYESLSGFQCLLGIMVYLFIVFALAIVLDQPRKWLYRKYLNGYLSRIDDKYKS